MSELIPIDQLDPKVRQAVHKAEKTDGFQYGALIHDTRGECFAHVSFYPTRKWWLTFRDTKERVELTRELASHLRRLML